MTAPATGPRMLWAGRVVSGLLVLALVADAVAKLVKPAAVVEGTIQLGYQESVIVPLGVVLLACTLLYAVPRTAVLGAILLTGYLGGAVATHVHASEPFWFPIVFGILVYLFMNFVVLPLSAFPFDLSYPPLRLLEGFVSHGFLVGIPIALAISRFTNPPQRA